MRKLNVRFLLALVLVLAAAVTGVAVVHYLQTGRIARALLAQAAAAEEQGQAEQAALYLSRYLEFVPDDVEQRARLGRTLAGRSLAGSPRARRRAVLILEQVLGRDPDRRDCRRLLVQVALDSRDLARAGEHLKILRESAAVDPEAEALAGRFHELRQEYDKAVACYRKAIENDPQQVESYARLADLLRRHPAPGMEADQAQEAERVINDLVARNGESYRARLARWRYRQSWGDLKGPHKLQEAGIDVTRARELAPDDPEVIVAVAEKAQAEGKPDDARRELQRGLALLPGEIALHRAAVAVEMQAGDRARAAQCLRCAAGAVSSEARAEFLWMLTHLLIDGDDKERQEAEACIAQIRKGPSPAAAGDYLQGRLLFARGRFGEAAPLLERTRPSFESTPEVLDQIDLCLGRCYEKLADPARQSAAAARLVERRPGSLPGRLALAAAEASLGRIDTALEHYRRAVALPGAPPEARFEFLRLLVVRNLGRADPSWDEVTRALADAEQALPGSLHVALLRAEAQAAQNKLGEARRTLETAIAHDAEGKHPLLRAALAALLDRQGEGARALQVLNELEKSGDSADVRTAHARFWARRPPEEARDALTRLEQGMDGWPAAEQSRVLRAAAEVHVRHGRFAEAEKLCARLAALPGNENDSPLRLLLCELALRNRSDATLARALEELRKIEGDQGPAWCCGEALRLIAQARQGQRDGLPQARTLLEQAAARRPGWTSLLLARAELAELEGRPEEAIGHYRQLLALGERSPRLSRRLVELLYRQQRYREAQEEIQELQRRAPSRELQLLAADLSLRNQDPARAVRLAVEAIPAESDKYLDHLWLGEILAASGQRLDEAERHLRRAVALAEVEPATWVALVHFLVSRGRTEEAARVVEDAKVKLPAAKLPLALAPCYEALDQTEAAQKAYQAALAAEKNNVAVVRGVAAFYLRTLRPSAAEPHLRRIIERKIQVSEADVAWARSGLAVVLASRGDHANFLEALKLVGLKLDDAGEAVEDRQSGEDSIERRRARARVLATRPMRPLRLKAIALLEELEAQGSLLAGDRFLLSQLYEATEDWAKAEEQMRLLAAAHGREPLYLHRYAQLLLRREKLTEARAAVERLELAEKARGAAAGTFGSAELRARLLEATGEGERALALLKEYVARPGARPADLLLLIGSCTRQKRHDEALALCEQAWQKGSPELIAGPHVGLLRAARLTGAPCERAARLLTAALQQAPRSPALLLALADLEDLRGRFDEAERYYRRVLAADVAPENVVALNNLAWLLSQRGRGGEEALKHINRAIEVLGPRADLLDTRAMVYLAMGQAEPARADLRRSIADTPTAARYFHLARAHRLAGDDAAAAAALLEARARKLKRSDLHPVEQLACAGLLEQFEER